MAENVITGFIINISDYEIYDQILTLLLPNNLKLTLIALGTKKILSKNARNISLLNQVEAEVFLARNINKISKLKKIISLYNFSWEDLTNKIFKIFLNYVNYQKDLKEDFYSLLIYLINHKDEEYQILLSKLLKLIFIDLGLKFYFNDCINCHNKFITIISIEYASLICSNCNDYKEKSYPLWFIKDFFYFFYDEDKLIFNDNKQKDWFYISLNLILIALIDKHAGYKIKI
ncbi:MAG: hypothetical protein IIT97_03520 [Mycoplasmataceae bacterium]|nr:hypothetical protein [Mycoplasmataceae bacterium]